MRRLRSSLLHTLWLSVWLVTGSLYSALADRNKQGVSLAFMTFACALLRVKYVYESSKSHVVISTYHCPTGRNRCNVCSSMARNVRLQFPRTRRHQFNIVALTETCLSIPSNIAAVGHSALLLGMKLMFLLPLYRAHYLISIYLTLVLEVIRLCDQPVGEYSAFQSSSCQASTRCTRRRGGMCVTLGTTVSPYKKTASKCCLNLKLTTTGSLV